VRGICFSRPRQCDARVLAFAYVRSRPRGVAVRRAPEPGPIRGDRGELFGLSVRPFAALPQGGGVRCP
jgi:hypothetical protein